MKKSLFTEIAGRRRNSIEMKSAMFQPLRRIALAILLTLSFSASAFYDPHIGRWISRDPIGDAAFVAFQEVESAQLIDSEQNTVNLYGFVNNQPISQWDDLGLLLSTGGGVANRGLRRHDSYLTFYVICPKCKKFQFDHVDYSGAVPALEALFGRRTVDDIAGTIPPAAGLGGLKEINGINCAATPTTTEVFMRSRFASITLAPRRGAAAAAAYAAGTVIFYDCVDCGSSAGDIHLPGFGDCCR